MKLYEISHELEETLLAAVDPETGEFDEVFTEALNELEIKLSAKVLDCGCVVKGFKAEADAIHEEERRLAARRRALENNAERLKSYVTEHIEQGQKFKDARVSLSWSRSQQVVIRDLDLLPPDYKRITVAPDKEAVGRALKDGNSVPGAQLVEHQSLQVR